MREIHNDAREKTRFCHTQQKSRGIKLHRCLHERGERGTRPPRNENPREPFPRAPPFDKQGAWNFKNQITNEKDAKAKPEDFLRKLEVISHREFGKPGIGSVKVSDDVKKEYQ